MRTGFQVNSSAARAHDPTPQAREQRMVDQEERLPEIVRHPGRQRAGDQQTADDVEPHRGPVHHKVVADGG